MLILIPLEIIHKLWMLLLVWSVCKAWLCREWLLHHKLSHMLLQINLMEHSKCFSRISLWLGLICFSNNSPVLLCKKDQLLQPVESSPRENQAINFMEANWMQLVVLKQILLLHFRIILMDNKWVKRNELLFLEPLSTLKWAMMNLFQKLVKVSHQETVLKASRAS